jgi:acyl carrier protein
MPVKGRVVLRLFYRPSPPADFTNSLPLRHHLAIIPAGQHQTANEGGKLSDQDYVLTNVREAFKTAFDVDPQLVSMDTKVSDIAAWDSVGHLSLASSLEEVFGINLDVDELMEMESVRGIVRVITTKLSEKV